MDWVVAVVLLVLATGLAALGARLMSGGRRGSVEAGTDRAVLSLVLLSGALCLGAVGAAVASSGATGAVQVGVFLAAAAAVVLPVAGVLLAARRGPR